jgi:redox-sensitive bicupin YhaK (pirin superfamily)
MNSESAIVSDNALGFTWGTQDPFLFCVHHHDIYPPGNENLGLDTEHLKGRNIGQDFDIRNGFRMYHGSEVPGFPAHPHSGFETVTIVLKGFIDHSDSLGAAARFGEGDVQWMTAGKGVQHSEMFPLLKNDSENELELFQIWLNLPEKSRSEDAFFKMLWSEEIPVIEENSSRIKLIAGRWGENSAPTPTPNSWGNDPNNELAIWLIDMDENAELELPLSSPDTKRQLFFFEGERLKINDFNLRNGRSAILKGEVLTRLKVSSKSRILLLQSKAINEPSTQHGPFVAASQNGIFQAIQKFQNGEFGTWQWEGTEPVHDKNLGRFAKYPDGKLIHP